MKKKITLTPLKQGQHGKLTNSPVPVISSYLTTAEKNALFTSNQTFYHKFQPHFILTSLLQYVVTANQNKVIQILCAHPELMVIQGRVTDMSGRTFPKASAAELVRWCGDLRYMASAMLDILKRLPNQALAEKIRAKWVALDKAYDLNGLELVLPGSTEPTKSFAFSLDPLLNALQAYIDTFNTLVCQDNKMTWKERDAHWCTKVGAEQRLLTAYYLRLYYCNSDGFDARHRCQDYQWPPLGIIDTDSSCSVWSHFGNWGILGRDFGIVRGRLSKEAEIVSAGEDYMQEEYIYLNRPWCPGREGDDMVHCVNYDLSSLRACAVRTALDLLDFKKELLKPLYQQPVEKQKPSSCSIS